MGSASIPLAAGAGGTATAWQAGVAAASLLLIVVGGELFTTGAEWAGDRLGLGQTATGSVLAVFATALPETLIPALAILQGSGATIGMGAILGGPITLTTFAVFLLGAAAAVRSARGGRESPIRIDAAEVRRDLRIFLGGFSLAAIAAVVRGEIIPLLVAPVLVVGYLWHLVGVTRRTEAGGGTDPEPLEFGVAADAVGRHLGAGVAGRDGSRDHGREPPTALVVVQVVVATAMLFAGAHLLVGAIEWASGTVVPVPTVIVALLVAPLVSNLPENVDGVIWVTRDKDDLAVGQVAGALAFQGTVGVAIGVVFTPWRLSPARETADFLVGISVVVALAGGAVLYRRVAREGGAVRPRTFLAVGLLYAAFLALVGYAVAAGLV